MVIFDEDKQNRKVKEMRDQDAEHLAQVLAKKYNFEYSDLTITAINVEALRLIDENRAREVFVAPFNIVGKKIDIAILSPQNSKTTEILEELKQKGYQLKIHLVSSHSLETAWSHYKDLSFSFETKAGSLDISNEQITSFLKEVRTIEDVKKLITDTLALKKSHLVTKILEIIISGALATEASDVHLEPEIDYVRIRYRLDGVLMDIAHFDLVTFNLILSRIKLLSGLKLNTKESPQDGRFSIKLNENDIEIRTSTIPGAYSESVVMRILNPQSIGVPVEELGIEPRLYAILEKELRKPNGMILTTGPTGSGKTTTLYAFLKKVHSPEVKIITIENPIEYHLPGVVQTQTDSEKGYTFLSGLRSALRQDPDVIMVGEIRDEETAEIAINAALTGHLVFSTLHTNNAAGTFPRLIDLGVNSKVITSAVNIAMAQRLVRKLCPKCRKEAVPNETQKKIIESTLATISDKENIPTTYTLFEAVGCTACNMTGYKGRIGLYEAIITTEEVEKVVINNPSERDIRAAAHDQGIHTLQQDGILKVIRGITTLEELERVVDLEEVK